MRILVSAYACEPGRGSEPGVGWNYAKEMSRRHSLTVLTRANNRHVIEGAGEDWTKSVRWLYYDPPRWLTFWKKCDRGVQLFYLIWQLGAARRVRHCCNAGDFDAIHHVTFGKYWIPTFVHLPGVPVVFGPVGGGDETPRAFRRAYSLRGRAVEAKKALAERLSVAVFRRAYRRMSLAIAATNENAVKLRRIVKCPVVVHLQSALSDDEIAAIRLIADVAERPAADAPRFVTACRLEHWKAIDLAVKAFSTVLAKKPKAVLEILGTGPEDKRLRRLVGDLGMEKSVFFAGRLPTLQDVYRKVASATALVHPALHESFGQACLEAVALGTPVICFDHGGPGLIARMCGFSAIPVPKTTASLSGLSHAMLEASSVPRPSLPDSFRWSHWCDHLEGIFRSNGLVSQSANAMFHNRDELAKELLVRIEAEGIPVTVLHGMEGGSVGRDLDVWIERDRWADVSRVAMTFGRSAGLRPVRIDGPPGLRFLFFADPSTCGTLELHCVRNLDWFWVKRPDDIAALHTWKRFAVLLATKQTGKVHRELSREPLATNERALINAFFARRGILCGFSRSRFWDAVDQGDFQTASRLLRRSVFHATPLHPFRLAVFALRRIRYAIWSFRKPAGVCLVIKDGADDPTAIAADLERRRGVLVKVRSVDLRRAGTLKTIVAFVRIRIGQGAQCATIIIIRPGQRRFARILAGPVFHQKGTDPVSRLSEALCTLATIRTSQA